LGAAVASAVQDSAIVPTPPVAVRPPGWLGAPVARHGVDGEVVVHGQSE
jgi:hypothetical protein